MTTPSTEVHAEVRCQGLIDGSDNLERVLRSLAALAGTVARPSSCSYQVVLQSPTPPIRKIRLTTEIKPGQADSSRDSLDGPPPRPKWLVVSDMGRPWNLERHKGVNVSCRPVSIGQATGDAVSVLLSSGMKPSSEAVRQGWEFAIDTPGCTALGSVYRVLEPAKPFASRAAGGGLGGSAALVPALSECSAAPGPYPSLHAVELVSYVPEPAKAEAARALEDLAALIGASADFVAPIDLRS